MNYLILIFVGAVGIIVGSSFAKATARQATSKQSKQKVENKKKVLQLFESKEKVVNDDVEKLLGISDATATRYLNELEKEQKIRQIGETGQSVYYLLR